MCGIAAIIGDSGNKSLNIKTMISSISHRGPDDEGFLNKKKVSIGSCRLSIFDFSEKGKMPMTDKSGRYDIVYNGEIYNFKELKKKYNIQTISGTDTEVLLELFSRFGIGCLKMLNGIFSFIIYDNLDKKVFCVRDRLGVKPLFYTNNNGSYYFCSEIKGILKIFNNNKVNLSNVQFYLETTFYDTSNETFYENIFQLEQSTCLVIDLESNKVEKIKYWDIENNENYEENILDNFLTNSFTIQQRSDTKLGLNVSSGLDSNLMISYLNSINGGQKNISANSYFFSDPEYDHRKDLKEMSDYYNWKINTHEIKSKDISDNFEEVFESQDEPFPGIVTIAKHLLIKKSYSKDIKVIFEGQGGDELAAGYKYVFPLHILDLIKQFKLINAFKEIKSFNDKEDLSSKSFIKFFINSLRGFFYGGVSADGTRSDSENILRFEENQSQLKYKKILSKLTLNKSLLKKILYRDIFFCKLSRILRTCDRSSMAHGKELRVPLLDHNIANFFFSSKNEELIKNGILRNSYRNFTLKKFKNNKFIKKKKYYVSDPQTKWLKTSLFSWVNDILGSKNLYIHSFIDKKNLSEYLNNFKKNIYITNSNFIWQLLNVEHLIKKNSKLNN